MPSNWLSEQRVQTRIIGEPNAITWWDFFYLEEFAKRNEWNKYVREWEISEQCSEISPSWKLKGAENNIKSKSPRWKTDQDELLGKKELKEVSIWEKMQSSEKKGSKVLRPLAFQWEAPGYITSTILSQSGLATLGQSQQSKGQWEQGKAMWKIVCTHFLVSMWTQCTLYASDANSAFTFPFLCSWRWTWVFTMKKQAW